MPRSVFHSPVGTHFQAETTCLLAKILITYSFIIHLKVVHSICLLCSRSRSIDVKLEELYCEDANYLLAGDRINDILSLPAEKVKQLTPVLACADRSVKVSCDWWRPSHVTSTLALIGCGRWCGTARWPTRRSCPARPPPSSSSTTTGASTVTRCQDTGENRYLK